MNCLTSCFKLSWGSHSSPGCLSNLNVCHTLMLYKGQCLRVVHVAEEQFHISLVFVSGVFVSFERAVM